MHGNVVYCAAHVESKRKCLIIIANPMIFAGLSNFTKINIRGNEDRRFKIQFIFKNELLL